jgi:hypothetical protein
LFPEAERIFRRVLVGLTAEHGEESLEALSATRNLGRLLEDRGDIEGAEAMARRARASAGLLLFSEIP